MMGLDLIDFLVVMIHTHTGEMTRDDKFWVTFLEGSCYVALHPPWYKVGTSSHRKLISI